MLKWQKHCILVQVFEKKLLDGEVLRILISNLVQEQDLNIIQTKHIIRGVAWEKIPTRDATRTVRLMLLRIQFKTMAFLKKHLFLFLYTIYKWEHIVLSIF